jgi:hypothetical protein
MVVKQDTPVKKEPWDSSTDKAKTLTCEDFGTPDEVRELAKPQRMAQKRREAAVILKKIAKKGILVSQSALKARLTGKTIGKIISSRAITRSCSVQAHYLAAANLDYLFKNAIEPWKFELNPEKNNDGLKERRYLYAPFMYEEALIIVKCTVKEYLDEKLENKLYSIEALDVKI